MTRVSSSDASSSQSGRRPTTPDSPAKRPRVEASREQPRRAATPPRSAGQRLPPLHTLTTQGEERARGKLEQLRRLYMADVALVHRELRAALGVCRRSQALLGLALPPDNVRKLERSVETLHKLARLLAARPAPRLRGSALFSLLCAVEAQIKTQVLPVATVIRSFGQGAALVEPRELLPAEQRGVVDCKAELLSPRSPSAVLPVSSSSSSSASSAASTTSSTTAPTPTSCASAASASSAADKPLDPSSSWRYLSMVLSLQL